MDIYCTRPNCPDPINAFPILEDSIFRSVQQRYCAACTMPLILDGRYLPLTRLGGGAFGTTFLGIDLRSAKQRHCVIKQLQLRPDLADNQIEGVKRAFRREAEILELLGDNHQQIPTLYAYLGLTAPTFLAGRQADARSHASEEYIYLVQEYVKGQDLDKELRRNGPFSEPDVLEIAQQILPVLQFIHQHGAIHRDIKPSNMVRDRTNRLYLIDFGAVKQVTTGVPLQSNSLVFGTLGFAPPEQIAGKQVYPSTDLYSFAVTLLCLLTGQPPEALLDVAGDGWHWRSFVQVSDRLGTVLDKMLEFIPGRRYPSADAVLDALFQPESIVLKPIPQATSVLPSQETDLQAVDVAAYWPNAHQTANQVNLANAETVLSPPSQPPAPPSPPIAAEPIAASNRPQATLNPMFVTQCQQELAYFIGPIASLVIEEAITQHSPASLQQLVDLLMQEIPDPQAALEFRRRLLS
jgi:serine/threonine protein kinase